MSKPRFCLLAAAVFVTLAACHPLSPAGGAAPPVTAPAVAPAATAQSVPPLAAPVTPEPIPTSSAGSPEEAIFIQEPGPGSRLASPIHVSGLADPAFAGALTIQLLNADGALLNSVSAALQAGTGPRQLFAADLPYEVTGEQPGFLQVLASSPPAGQIIHLAAAIVTLTPAGPAQIQPAAPQPEQIWISWPKPGETASGGSLHVEGAARASFEQTLLIQLLDAAGNIVGSQPVTVQAPDMGQPGPFVSVVPYSIAAAGPGRVVVRDVSPAFGGDVHVASVDINLEP